MVSILVKFQTRSQIRIFYYFRLYSYKLPVCSNYIVTICHTLVAKKQILIFKLLQHFIFFLSGQNLVPEPSLQV